MKGYSDLLSSTQETPQEVLAIREFFLKYTTFNKDDFHFDSDAIVDIAGTGGDGLKTFNISTAASLVVASFGIPVVKHGGGKITSTTGSADVIQHLGIHASETAKEVNDALTRFSYAFLRASQFNTLFDQLKSARVMKGSPTVLNILGPLMNPVSSKRIVLGVYRESLIDIVAKVLVELGVIHALVVHAESGLDELCVCSNTRVAEIHHGTIKHYVLSTQDIELSRYDMSDLTVADAVQSAQILQDIFNGELHGAKKDAVLLNAAAGFLVADVVDNLNDGILIARDLVDTGKTAIFLCDLSGGHHV